MMNGDGGSSSPIEIKHAEFFFKIPINVFSLSPFGLFFSFLSPFLPTLCARTGSVDAPPANREEAKMRRSGGQIWSI